MKPVHYLILIILTGGLLLVWNLFAQSTATQTPKETTPEFAVTLDNKPKPADNLLSLYHGTRIPGTEKFFGMTDTTNTWAIFDPATKTLNSKTSYPALDGLILRLSPAPNSEQVIARYKPTLDETAKTVLITAGTNEIIQLNPSITTVAWLPDSSAIVYLYWNTPLQTFQLAEAKPNGSEWRILLERIPFYEPELSLSPDGKKIIISRKAASDLDRTPTTDAFILFQREANTVEQIPLTDTPARPVWSPDSKKIAYYYPEANTTPARLGIYNFETAKEIQVQIAADVDLYAWQTNDQLFAVNTTEAGQSIWRVGADQTLTQALDMIIPPLTNIDYLAESKQLLLIRRSAYLAIPLDTLNP